MGGFVPRFRPLLYEDNIVITLSFLPTDTIIEVRSLSDSCESGTLCFFNLANNTSFTGIKAILWDLWRLYGAAADLITSAASRAEPHHKESSSVELLCCSWSALPV